MYNKTTNLTREAKKGTCIIVGLRFLGLRFLGLPFLGLRFLRLRFMGLRSLFSRSSFSRHPPKIEKVESRTFRRVRAEYRFSRPFIEIFGIASGMIDLLE